MTAIESRTGAFATHANRVHADDPHTILVADDSRVFRKLMENTLSPRYELIFAKTGQEAVDLFSEHTPSLVIVDWMMPDRTGIEICQHIRSGSQGSYTHIIILTAKVEKDSVVAGLQAGADDYLTKPFHNEELLARVGVGVRNIGLHREIEAKNVLLKELALTDALTGLPNRRAIEDWAHRQLSAAARYRFSFWVVAADLDHFKSINDTYGHEAGDTVLKTFAEILKAHSRSSDMCGRIGGEEFLSVITHASRANARLVVERIRAALEGTRFLFDGRNLMVTASFGLAGVEGSNVPPFGELVAWADSALYSAKRQGRNRVEIADSGAI